MQREDVAVAVDDEAGEEVGFAEDDAVGFGVCYQGLAVGDGGGDSLAKQVGKISDWVVRDHADGDLGRAGVERGAEGLATVVGDADEGAGLDAFGGDDVGAVDPDVAVFEADGAAGGDLHRG